MREEEVKKIFNKVNNAFNTDMWKNIGKRLAVHIEYVGDYFTEDNSYLYENCAGMFDMSSQKDIHTFPIAINLKLINKIPLKMREKEVYKTIYHELGHALITFLDDNDFEVCTHYFDEEDLAEDFADAVMNGEITHNIIWQNVEKYMLTLN